MRKLTRTTEERRQLCRFSSPAPRLEPASTYTRKNDKEDGSRRYPAAVPNLRMFALYDFGEAVGDGLTLVELFDFCLPFGEP